LNPATCVGGLLVVVCQSTRVGGIKLEDVIHERVHDGHGLRGDACVQMNLMQHLIYHLHLRCLLGGLA
uniref:Secreted protein n=1 Tax=Rodentolepis nana TaxID=102285 RepID=A0A0R3TYW9_RODNA